MGHDGGEYPATRSISEWQRRPRDGLPDTWFNSIFDIYRRMRERTESGPYETTIAGNEIIVCKDVYAPGYFTDTEWFASTLPAYIAGSRLLEIGTGTGAIALACYPRCKEVLATDVNAHAVRNATLNAKVLNADLRVICSDVYDDVPKGELFDYIFWAHPFNNWPSPVEDELLISGLDYQYRALEKYIREAHRHLTPHGRLLLGTGDSADLEAVERFGRAAGLRARVIAYEQVPLEAGQPEEITYILCEFVAG